MAEWYEDKNNLIELADFMVETEQLITAKELLVYFKHPERYTEVWKLYQGEILGKPTRVVKCRFNVPNIVALIKPSDMCISQ